VKPDAREQEKRRGWYRPEAQRQPGSEPGWAGGTQAWGVAVPDRMAVAARGPGGRRAGPAGSGLAGRGRAPPAEHPTQLFHVIEELGVGRAVQLGPDQVLVDPGVLQGGAALTPLGQRVHQAQRVAGAERVGEGEPPPPGCSPLMVAQPGRHSGQRLQRSGIALGQAGALGFDPVLKLNQGGKIEAIEEGTDI